MDDVEAVITYLLQRLPRALVRISDISLALGMSLEAVSLALRRAEALGVVEQWASLACVVLAQAEAARIGVILESPSSARPDDIRAWRWSMREHNEKSTIATLGNVEAEARSEPEPVEPDELERYIRKPRSRTWDRWRIHPDAQWLRASKILDRVGWSPAIERTYKADETCEVCNGQLLPFDTCCLGCMKSGMDNVLPRVKLLPDRRLYQPHATLRGGRK
jgi:hypothetical protein